MFARYKEYHAKSFPEVLKALQKVSDCSQVSDGGAALLLVSEAGLQKLGRAASEAGRLEGVTTAGGLQIVCSWHRCAERLRLILSAEPSIFVLPDLKAVRP